MSIDCWLVEEQVYCWRNDRTTYQISQHRGRRAWLEIAVGFIVGKAVLVKQKTEPVPIRLKGNGTVSDGPVLISSSSQLFGALKPPVRKRTFDN